jgi:hypothetical protein
MRTSLRRLRRSPLPLGDPFRQPFQIGAGRNQQGGFQRLARPDAVSLFAITKAEDDPCPFGQKVAPTTCDLAQLGECDGHVQRLTAGVAAGRAGESGGCDPVRVRAPAADGHTWTVPLIEQTFYRRASHTRRPRADRHGSNSWLRGGWDGPGPQEGRTGRLRRLAVPETTNAGSVFSVFIEKELRTERERVAALESQGIGGHHLRNLGKPHLRDRSVGDRRRTVQPIRGDGLVTGSCPYSHARRLTE